MAHWKVDYGRVCPGKYYHHHTYFGRQAKMLPLCIPVRRIGVSYLIRHVSFNNVSKRSTQAINEIPLYCYWFLLHFSPVKKWAQVSTRQTLLSRQLYATATFDNCIVKTFRSAVCTALSKKLTGIKVIGKHVNICCSVISRGSIESADWWL